MTPSTPARHFMDVAGTISLPTKNSRYALKGGYKYFKMEQIFHVKN